MSSDPALVVDELTVRDSVANSLEGLQLDELCPGINVVYGPNASGKSTLATLIRTLLWPDEQRADQASVVGRIRCDDSRWRIDVDANTVVRRADGGHRSVDEPDMPPASASDRYYLCLRELLTADGASFAETILRESVGGYDVEEAARSLGFERPSLRRRKATREVEEANRQWKEARQQYQDLRSRHREIDQWKRRLEKVDRASKRIEAVEIALSYREFEQTRRALENRLAGFPDGVAELRGDELDVVKTKTQEASKAEIAEEKTCQKITKWRRKLESNPAAEDAPSPARLEELTGYVTTLESVEQRIREVERAVAEKSQRRDRRWQRLGGRVAANDAPPLDAELVDELLTLARQSEGVAARRRAFDEWKSFVGDADIPPNLEEMRRGISLLHRWTRHAPGESPSPIEAQLRVLRPTAAGCAVVLIGLALVGWALGHLWTLILVLPAAATGWMAWALRRQATDRDDDEKRRSVVRRDFEALDLSAPSSWTVEAVDRRLDELVESWSRGMVEAQKARFWERLRPERESIEDKSDEIDRRHRRLSAQIGCSFDEKGASAWMRADALMAWQKAREDVDAIRRKLETLRDQRRQLCEQIDEVLTPMGYETVGDAVQARTRIETVTEAVREARRCREKLDDLGDELERIRADKQSARRRVDEIFDRHGVESVAELETLIERKPSYDELNEDWQVADRRARDEKSRLLDCEAGDDPLLEKTKAQLRAEHSRLREVVDERDDILRRLEAVRTEIEAAKKATDAEQRWAEYQSKRNALRNQRSDDMRRAIGSVLTDFVRRQTRDRSRPEVFHRARRLFNTITRGRYRLELIESDDRPRFCAVDEAEDVEYRLQELSSGTRVQLHLAVRMAFVECQEPGAKLPVVFDEALANSDDVRASAIVDAIETIASGGRQVFYLTAQSDEVDTWRNTVAESEVEGTIVDLGRLAAATPGDDAGVMGDDVRPPKPESIPEPQTLSHREYGRILGVEHGLDPWANVEEIHLWMVVDDTRRLYRLLTEGVETWGQLHSLARFGGLDVVGLSDEAFRRIEACIDALDALQKAWAIGRGRPVDRRALCESGAVTDTFIERVTQLCEDVDGDAARLLEKLEEGCVKRFRSANIEQLRRFFESRGHLDSNDRLGPNDIWVRVKAAVSEALRAGRIDDDELRQLIRRASRVSQNSPPATGAEGRTSPALMDEPSAC